VERGSCSAGEEPALPSRPQSAGRIVVLLKGGDKRFFLQRFFLLEIRDAGA
jgi:hypothetical protein